MDEGAGEDAKLKAALVKEANVAFLLNTHLFTLITPPPAVKPRYYERLATENERRTRLAGPGPTLAEKAMRVGYMLAAVFVVLFAMQLLAPILEPYARPAYDAYVAPVINNTLVPFYNNKFVPWWDSVAPMLHRQMAAQSRRMI
jgi:heme oxygenase